MKTYFVSILLVTLFITATATMAQQPVNTTSPMGMHGKMPMNSMMMHDNMASMGEMLMQMGNALEQKKMSDVQRLECARYMQKLSEIMDSCAKDVELKTVETQKTQIIKLNKEWDYFKSQEFESH